LILATYGITEQ
jgi:hypothetical protein